MHLTDIDDGARLDESWIAAEVPQKKKRQDDTDDTMII